MTAMTPLRWNDFPETSRLLASAGHRPWPLPEGPWIMSQSWHDLLFAHWRVDAQLLRRVVPAQLPLDLFGGQAWVGVVPFHMTNVAPRLVPEVPPLSRLTELNAGLANQSNAGFLNDARLESFLGRVNYTLMDRYLFTGSVRRDGSSRFGPNNRYGTFGSASVGWVLSEESFFAGSPLAGTFDFLSAW